MNISEIKSLILERRELVVQMLPSDKQLRVIKHVKSAGSVTREDIAAHFGIGLQAATVQLGGLCLSNWLTRVDIGGRVYLYSYKSG